MAAGRASSKGKGDGEGRRITRKMLMRLLKDTLKDWQVDNVSLMAAGLSYYAVLALAPLMVLALIIASRVYPDEAQARITLQITRFIGARIAAAVGSMMAEASRPSGGLVPLIASAVTLFIATSGAFAQLMNALDVIWKVRPSGERGLLGRVLDRLLAFGMVLVMLLALTATFVVSTVLARASRLVPIDVSYAPLLNIVLSLALATLLFAAIFKVLPRVYISWRDVWIGAIVTAVLFVVGKELLSLYLGLSNISSGYGAAGSVVVILIFVYFSSHILLLGAEFTKHYARRLGTRPPVDEYAVRYRIVTEKEGEGYRSSESEAAEEERGSR